MFRIAYRYVFILLLGLYSFLNILFTVGTGLFDFALPGAGLLALLTLVVACLWELNRLTDRHLDKLSGMLRHRVHPLIILFAVSLLWVLLVCLVCLQLVYALMHMPLGVDVVHYRLLLAFGFRVNLFLHCVNAIVYFMNRLKKAQVAAEEFKKISILAQFEALRSQINPHFPFNCLNVLSTLVYKDADTSAKFIGQLSHVYRYLLYNQEKKVVPLKDEITFIDAYLYLLKMRFGENIMVHTRLAADQQKYFVAPAVIQMLIENAIKHNVVSRKRPLRIELYDYQGFIVVSNNLQKKEVEEESTNVGLSNIIRRYGFLSDEQVWVEKTETDFTVRIPLLLVEE